MNLEIALLGIKGEGQWFCDDSNKRRDDVMWNIVQYYVTSFMDDPYDMLIFLVLYRCITDKVLAYKIQFCS